MPSKVAGDREGHRCLSFYVPSLALRARASSRQRKRRDVLVLLLLSPVACAPGSRIEPGARARGCLDISLLLFHARSPSGFKIPSLALRARVSPERERRDVLQP